MGEVVSGDEASFTANNYYDYATTPKPGYGPSPVYGSGTMYIICHAETKARSHPLASVPRESGAHTTSRPGLRDCSTYGGHCHAFGPQVGHHHRHQCQG